jgi:hypothetical protein
MNFGGCPRHGIWYDRFSLANRPVCAFRSQARQRQVALSTAVPSVALRLLLRVLYNNCSLQVPNFRKDIQMALTHTDETGEALKTIHKALGKWEEVLTVLQSLHHILHPPFYTHRGHPLRIVSSGRIREQKYAPVTYTSSSSSSPSVSLIE